jgi:hypothetical protein
MRGAISRPSAAVVCGRCGDTLGSEATPLSLHAAAPNETRTEAPFALNYSIFVDTKGAGEREAVSNAVASSSEEIATHVLSGFYHSLKYAPLYKRVKGDPFPYSVVEESKRTTKFQVCVLTPSKKIKRKQYFC